MNGQKRTSEYLRTDDTIVRAFYSLLEAKGFEKMTVSDIIREADINRSTFYRHYADKYQILESIRDMARPYGDMMIAPLTDGSRHPFDVLFCGDYLTLALPDSFKRIFSSLLQVHTEEFDMERITKEGFAYQYKPNENSYEIGLQREIYADICYRLLLHSLSEPERMKQLDVYKMLRDISEYLSSCRSDASDPSVDE